MSLQHFFRRDDNVVEEITDHVRLYTFEATMQAEEGSVGSSTVTVDDPDADLTIGGHRLFYSTESTATGSNVLAYVGYTANREVHRGPFKNGASRVWDVNLVDVNSVLARRILTGSSANRPAETDVARMQWLFGTEEADIIDDVTTLFDATGGVAMDAVDYRGQRVEDVANDCANASGKNYYITSIGTFAGNFVLWYGFDDSTLYRSPIRLSNDLDDIDNVLTFAIADDTTLNRDPSRVYSGVYLPYDGGGNTAVYVQSNTTAQRFALKGRDVQMDGANVKTAAKATARANRYLADLDEEEDRITTAVLLPAAQQGFIREGMAVQFKATHLPGYSEFVWVRVLTRTLSQPSEEHYLLKLELASDPGSACLEIVQSGAQNGVGNVTETILDPAPGNVMIAITSFRGPGPNDPPESQILIGGLGVGVPGTEYVVQDGTNTGGSLIQAASRTATAADTTTLFQPAGGTDRPVMGFMELRNGSVAGAWSDSGVDDLTMGIAGMSVGDGILMVGLQIHNYDIAPAPAITNPAGFVELYGNYRNGLGQDWVSIGYIEVTAGTVNAIWTGSMTFFDWHWQAVAIFVEGEC